MKLISLISQLIFFPSYSFILSQDAPFFIYCKTENCTEANGIPCERNPPCTPTRDCREMPINEALRFTITHFHNQVRSMTATTTPGASKMRALRYNKDLEIVAQCWINTCTTEKASCMITPLYNSLGQNIGSLDLFHKPGVNPSIDPAFFWQQIMNLWTEEVNDINAEIIQNLPDREKMYKYEHYIQIVTDYTADLGCAWSSSNDSLHFACFYGPPGGITASSVYEFGPFCTRCPNGTECYKPLGLCAKKKSGIQQWRAKLKRMEFSSAVILLPSIYFVFTLSFLIL